jgi:hypothetical protein
MTKEPTMAKSLHLTRAELRHADGRHRHVGCFERRDDGQVVSRHELWFEFDTLPTGFQEDHLEPFFIILVLPAMAEGRALHIHGPVPRRRLANLEEFRDAWHCLRPAQLQRIPIQVNTIEEDSDRIPLPWAVAACSGDLDAAFTLWRHSQGLAGHAALPIRQVIFIQDLGLADHPEQAEQALAGTRALADSLNLPLQRIGTNCQTEIATSMGLGDGALQAAALHYFKPVAGTGLIAASHSCLDPEMTTLGSNAITDPLLSSADFRIIHDGHAWRRIDKIAAVADWPEGNRRIRVCHEPAGQGGNCGACENCLFAMLGWLLAADRIPATFPPTTPDELRRRLNAGRISRQSRIDWAELADWIRETGRGHEWLPLVDRCARPHESIRGKLHSLWTILRGK